PHIEAFERQFEEYVGLPSLALSSGTAGIHLGLRLLDVGPGDEVFCQDLTFVASANPIRYLGAMPVFIDSDHETWNLSPEVLDGALRHRAALGRLPKAVVVVDLFGQVADMEPIADVCGRYNVPILEDAAEALGATYKGQHAGTLGTFGVFSFNGNKIITTSGGGMLVGADRERIKQARLWATQARDPGLAYEHSQIGYNYRLSNLLAGVGRAQLKVLQTRVAQRRAIAERYRLAFADVPGFTPMPQATYGLATNWLSCFLVDEESVGCSRDRFIEELDAAAIESRPVWKPMHLQKLYSGCDVYGGQVAESLFRRGICLPSSSSLSQAQQLRVINQIRKTADFPVYSALQIAGTAA
ncbi:MAG: DegT/DnrJ/EryC1/StrS family aminotransferase, partial [Acidobacteriota bacterium]|nr:DegT/DnrJ/EryC1/StrS family aminotransferase [Acidobacteriota bacterium]